MIQFSQLTLDETVNRVFLQLSQHRTATNLDYGTVVAFINLSIRESLIKTLAYKDFAYISSFPVSNGAPSDTNTGAGLGTMRTAGLILPPNYIKWKRVILHEDEGTKYNEARYVDAKEFFTLSDWQCGNSFNKATVKRPIFTIWGPQAVNNPAIQSVPRFYCAPYTEVVFNNFDPTGTAPAGTSYYSGVELSGFMDAYVAPQDLVAGSDTLAVPGEFEELVITLTVTRCLAKMEATGLDYYKGLTTEEILKLRKRFAERRKTDRTNLQAWVDTVPGQASLMPQPQGGQGA